MYAFYSKDSIIFKTNLLSVAVRVLKLFWVRIIVVNLCDVLHIHFTWTKKNLMHERSIYLLMIFLVNMNESSGYSTFVHTGNKNIREKTLILLQ